MRVTPALNRLLRLLGASVIDVCFGVEAIIVMGAAEPPSARLRVAGRSGRIFEPRETGLAAAERRSTQAVASAMWSGQ